MGTTYDNIYQTYFSPYAFFIYVMTILNRLRSPITRLIFFTHIDLILLLLLPVPVGVLIIIHEKKRNRIKIINEGKKKQIVEDLMLFILLAYILLAVIKNNPQESLRLINSAYEEFVFRVWIPYLLLLGFGRTSIEQIRNNLLSISHLVSALLFVWVQRYFYSLKQMMFIHLFSYSFKLQMGQWLFLSGILFSLVFYILQQRYGATTGYIGAVLVHGVLYRII